MNQGDYGLTPWKPTSTLLSEEWAMFVEHLDQQVKDSLFAFPTYILDVRYNSKRVGDQLRDWQIPWEAVIAGYLWEVDDELIQGSGLPDTARVINCKRPPFVTHSALRGPERFIPGYSDLLSSSENHVGDEWLSSI